MTDSNTNDLLAKLTGRGGESEQGDLWASVAATTPTYEEQKKTESEEETTESDEKLDGLINRINNMASGKAVPAESSPSTNVAATTNSVETVEAAQSGHEEELDTDSFIPIEPASFREASLTDTEVEALVLKYLLSKGDATGRDIVEQVNLPFRLIDELLRQMKNEQLVAHKAAAAMNDYVYQLTDIGRERARRYHEHCTYFGSAPVNLADYVKSVKAQSIEHQHPSAEDLNRAFEDLLINPEMLKRLGPAINSGRGLFLFGAAGNGKTSIAERVTKAFGQHIWIPKAIGIDGEILRMFDPSNHEEAPLAPSEGLLKTVKVDKRWVRIRRPTIVVGGELTMDNLEVTLNTSTGISEAPVQLKSNCGTLVIDDFGRQRMSTDELLNRWIVPLEKRYDFLNLANGKKIQVPFDQLIIFSTNLEPKDLCDDAFLRRIPYKIEVLDPSEEEFRELFKIMCPIMKFEYHQQSVDYLIQKHYKETKRPFRCCQPRDLLLQVRNYCLYQQLKQELKPDYFDFAVNTYFSTL